MSRGGQDMRVLEGAVRDLPGLYANYIPPRDVEGEATKAWIAVDRLTTAEASDLRDNMGALLEMRDKINTMIAEAKQ